MMLKEILIKYSMYLFMILLLVLSGYVIIKGWINGSFDSVESMREYVEGYGVWAPFILFLIQVLQVILPIIPGFMGCIVGAVLFGAAGGFIVNYAGISIGSIAAFLLAKKYGVSLVNKMVSMEKHEKYIARINRSRSYPMYLFVATLLPLAPDDFLCYFSGLINMSVKKFIVIIILGKPWCILFYCVFFDFLF